MAGIKSAEVIAKYVQNTVSKETKLFGGMKSILHTKPNLQKEVNFNELKLTSLKADSLQFKKPEYLYHLTTPQNYEKMLESGILKATKDSFFGNGVFMFDINNLFKQWGYSGTWGSENLKFKLIHHARKQGWDLVALKIPTRNIDKELKIRSQEELFKLCRNKPRFVLDKHILQGANAKSIDNFTGQSMEYIYPKNIDMSSVQKIGEVNIIKLQQKADYDKSMPLKSFFKTIFEGHCESKTAESLLNS